ncbi:peptidase M28 [Alicyclobacillus acidoterrestris]|nr:peptidase M28 [Alicyclobacillus acidoterrestris]
MGAISADVEAFEKGLLNQVSRAQLIEFNRQVAKEVRLSGSPEELRAFQYVQSQLDQFGYETDLTFSDAYISLPISAELAVDNEIYPCITHSMGTSVSGLTAPIVYVGKGQFGDVTENISGKIVLVDGLATPHTVKVASERGAVGCVFVNADYTHEMIISPVWGHPTPETVHLLPTVPAVSITRQVGDEVKAALERSFSVRCAITTKVDTGFRSIPTLVAELKGSHAPDDFVLFSGHIDSWHYGAMDNGSANALMLEVARVMAENRRDLQRSLRLAFWSGHSHGRYAGSSQYCDDHWEELFEHCVVHVNVDSVGGKGSTILTEANCMAETKPIAAAVIKALVDESFVGTRYGRSGDQSFWGPGVPSLFMGLSEQPPTDNPAAAAFGELFGGGKTGGFGWWWHTTEDTLDKVDPDCLVRDTQVYVSVIHRFLSATILPLDQHAAAKEIYTALVAWQEKAGEHLDLSPVTKRAKTLVDLLAVCEPHLRKLTENPVMTDEVNRHLMQLSRRLVPLNYVAGNVFDHDLALSQPAVPKLNDISNLVVCEPDCQEYRFLKVALRRKCNEISFALKQAIEELKQLQEQLQMEAK